MFHHVFRLAPLGGGYSNYGEVHQLPEFLYLHFSFLGLVIASLGGAGLLVFLLPALHRKGPTLLVGLTAIACGTVAAYGLVMPNWQQATMEFKSIDRSQNRQLLLGVRVGLSGTNFSVAHEMLSDGIELYWDQRLEFDSLDGMSKQFHDGLAAGLPHEILELEEQLAGCGIMFGQPAFAWPFHLRRAGYFSSWLLAGVIVGWLFTLVLLMALPTIGAFSLGVTGLGLTLAPVIYWGLLPAKAGPAGHLTVYGIEVPLHFGPCFWVCLFVGLWTATVGFGIRIYHVCRPDTFFTDFEVDYDALEEKRKHIVALELEQQAKERALVQEMEDSKIADTQV
ncbi:uncharacterized protein LOC132202592 [Neocloeon triangulifer]|uniref:uncharacterized protein LOC132202592 n=1 Tax=Neocloeon triangulifer TaxID=2078957 RepID=UPI00286F9C1B|nr:uncharacterized protein LOC132202592 [Neocloeon triangulifer]